MPWKGSLEKLKFWGLTFIGSHSSFTEGGAAGPSSPRPGRGDGLLCISILYCSAGGVSEEGGEAGTTCGISKEGGGAGATCGVSGEGGEAGVACGESGEVFPSDGVSVSGEGFVFEESESCGS